MILWFGKKKKQQELKDAGAAMEAPELSAEELAAQEAEIARKAAEQEEIERKVAEAYGPLNYRTAARTLFLRPYLAHFCPVFSRFFAVFSVLTPGFQKVAPKDRGAVP